MADGKWIPDLTADTALVEAVRKVFQIRLRVVADLVPLARDRAGDDPEYIHQLRVSTRRAGAALRIFQTCLPDRVFRKARKSLRKLRRAAAEARDWDVFLQQLSGWENRTNRIKPGLDFLVGLAFGHRLTAQELLVKAVPHDPAALTALGDDILAEFRSPKGMGKGTLGDLARRLLPDLRHELEKAAGASIANIDNLHRIRIAGKHLRYAMEIFAGCFGTRFRDKNYAAIEDMQEMLGQANDSHVARQRLRFLQKQLRIYRPADWNRFMPAIADLKKYHERLLPRYRQRFRKWWDGWEKISW